ncbi:MAG TPA: serine/threonine-protein kinase, partial [Gemmatirosa sp.]
MTQPTVGPDAGAAPLWIGPYRVLRVLGEGGMGVVYEAEQTTPIHRRVALKVVRAEVTSREVIARFAAERQALAVMTHEAIAKVLDAGASDTGQPYFVMELVRGVPITEYCDARKLSTRERIALFVPVCQAVQHAHQKGVIHRDLKPSNVLVAETDAGPAPKVIDFGIAKAVDRQLTERTLVTQFGQAMGTPAYMSPEQAEMSGLDVDTRTDVYSLGVMLYELLVGRLPVDPAEVGVFGFLARLAMRATDPPAPSAKYDTLAGDRVALATLRHTDPTTLRRQLRGDLDWIVMKAIEADRNLRYETANGLALDLARHLADEPVQARPPTAAYRARKFVRRNTAGVVAAGAIVAAVAAGSVAATAGLVRARRAAAQAREEAATAQQVSAFLTGLFKVSDPNRARGASITARAILDSGARKVATDLAGQPLVQARLMNTIGDVYAELGLYPEAEQLLDGSLVARRRSGAAPGDLAETLTSLGSVYGLQGRSAQAESTLRTAVGLAEAGGAPDTARTVHALRALSRVYLEQGRYATADTLTRRMIALLERSAGPDSPGVAEATVNLAISQAEQGRPADAEVLFRRAVAIREAETRAHAGGAPGPALGRAVSNLGGAVYEQGRLPEAEALYRRALAIDSTVFGPAHPTVARDLSNLANVRDNRGAHEEAIALYGRAIAIWERTIGPDHPNVATALTGMAEAYITERRPADALPLLRRALAAREHTLAPGHPFIATSYHAIGVAEAQLGDTAAAAADLRRALAMREKALDPTSYYTALTLAALGDLSRGG